MEILTGKAKEGFYYYVFNNIKEQLFGDLQDVYDYIYSLPISCKHALIIEWFDSLDIYVEIGLDKTTYPKYWVEISKYTHFGNYKEIFNDGLYKDRETATQQAIIKANEIYNILSKMPTSFRCGMN